MIWCRPGKRLKKGSGGSGLVCMAPEALGSKVPETGRVVQAGRKEV